MERCKSVDSDSVVTILPSDKNGKQYKILFFHGIKVIGAIFSGINNQYYTMEKENSNGIDVKCFQNK